NLLKERIVYLDGPMGTMLQQRRLSESQFRGSRFSTHRKDLKGNHDILNITAPDEVFAVHTAYLEAGADIIETNTFNSTSISQEDYGLSALAKEINIEAARIAKKAVKDFQSKH